MVWPMGRRPTDREGEHWLPHFLGYICVYQHNMEYNDIVMKDGRQWAKLGEHIWELPPFPDKKDILFSDLPVDQQYWRRPDIPKIFYDYNRVQTLIGAPQTKYDSAGQLTQLSYEDTIMLMNLRDREMSRRWHGIWFMNKGVPVYITGSHYFQLVYGAMPGVINEFAPEHPYEKDETNPYGQFLWYQCYYAYMRQLVREDRYCGGLYTGKAKKTGITQQITLDYLDESTKYKEKIFGFMSENKDKCLKTNWWYYTYAFDKLPDIFKPQVANRLTSEIKFGLPTVKSTGTRHAAKKELERKMAGGFDSYVFVAPTAAAAFDGPKLFRGQCDEFPKYKDPWPEEVFNKTKEAVKEGTRVNGKMDYSSYAPEDDGKHVNQAAEIWEQCSLDSMDPETRATTSGLYKYFIGCLDANIENFNIYGECDREKTRRIIMANRRQLEHKPMKLQGYVRQYPIHEGEMWQKGAGGSIFNNIRLGVREKQIKEVNKSGQTIYVEGRLEWEAERLGKVMFVPLTPEEIANGVVGSFRVYGWEYWKNSGLFNKAVIMNKRDHYGRLLPDEDTLFVGGSDPTDYVQKKDVQVGSNDAICVLIMKDANIDSFWEKPVTDRLMMDYLDRPEDPDVYYEDFVKSVLWTGGYFYLEGNKPWVFNKAQEDKLHNFLLWRGENGDIQMYNHLLHKPGEAAKQKKLDTVKSNNLNVVMDIINAIKRSYRLKEGEFDYLNLLDSERVIKCLMDFDAVDTKKYDMSMCYGFAQLAKYAVMAIRLARIAKASNYDPNIVRLAFEKLIA